MSDSVQPELEFENRACAVCGARTDEEAAARCQLSSDQTGERYCRGGAEEESFPDGRLRFVTAESLARLDAYYDAVMATERIESADHNMMIGDLRTPESAPNRRQLSTNRRKGDRE